MVLSLLFTLSIPNLFAIIGASWNFCMRQQAVGHVTVWFLFLPFLVNGLLADVARHNAALLEARPELDILIVLILVINSLIITWGMVCILTIGKRLLQAKSGRARSSFKAARTQARPLFIPYLLTSLLRAMTTFLWMLLFLVPGIVYLVRTMFFPVIIVCEGISYRPALQKSIDMVRGQFWDVALTMLGLAILTIAPAQILTSIFASMAEGAPPAIILAANIAKAIVTSVGLVIHTLALILLYAHFRPASERGPITSFLSQE